MMKYFSVIIGIIFVALVVSFSVVNTGIVSVVLPFVSVSISMPLYLVILTTAVLSFLLGVVFMLLHSFMVALRKRKQRKAEEAKQEAKA